MFQSQNNSKSKNQNIGLPGSFNRTAEFNFGDDPSPIKNKVYDLGQDFQSQLRSKQNNDIDDSIFRDTNFMECNIVDLHQVNIKTNKLAILKNYCLQDQDDQNLLRNYQQFNVNKNYQYKGIPHLQNGFYNQKLTGSKLIIQSNKWKKCGKMQNNQKQGVRQKIQQKAVHLFEVILKLKEQVKYIRDDLSQQYSSKIKKWIQNQLKKIQKKWIQCQKEVQQKNKKINNLQEEVYHLKTINQQFLNQIQQMQCQLKELAKYQQNHAESRQDQNKNLVKQIQSLIHQLNAEQNNYRVLNQEFQQTSSELQTIRQKYKFCNDQKEMLDKENHTLRQYVFDLEKTVEQLQEQKFKNQCYKQSKKQENSNHFYQEELIKQQQQSCKKLKELSDYFQQEMFNMNKKHHQQLIQMQKMYSQIKHTHKQKILQECLQKQKYKYNELYKKTTQKISELQQEIQQLQYKFYQNNNKIIQKQKQLQKRQSIIEEELKSKSRAEKEIKKKEKVILQLKTKIQEREKQVFQKQTKISIKMQELQYQKSKLKAQEELLKYKSKPLQIHIQSKPQRQYYQPNIYNSSQSMKFSNYKQQYQKPNDFFYRSDYQEENDKLQHIYSKNKRERDEKINILSNLSGYNSPLRSDLNLKKNRNLFTSEVSSRYNSPLNQKIISQRSKKIVKQEIYKQKYEKNEKIQMKQGNIATQRQIKSKQKLDMIRANCKNSNMKNIQHKLIKLKKDLQKQIVDMKV